MGISTARRLGLVPGSTKVDKMSLDFPDAVSKFISLYSTPVGLEIDHAVRPHADRPVQFLCHYVQRLKLSSSK